MKPRILLHTLSLLLSLAAFAIAVRAYQLSNPSAIDAQVDAALQKREQAFIQEVKPRLQSIFEANDPKYGKDWNPQTLEQLVEPITNISQEAE